MSAIATPSKSASTPKARSRAAGSKVTQPSTGVAATPLGASPKATKVAKVNLADLLAQHAAKAKDASDLASRCNVPDDVAFRRAVTHYAQGSRVLAAYRAKLIKPGDARVYIERHGKAKASA
jgi:hypothetical protein